jgi:hypothetical protein
MKKIISASRRTDLVAFFPEWLASAVDREEAKIYGPSGHTYTVDLSPQNVHTVVLWSKNFENLIDNNFKLKDVLRKYDQLYLHFTITGLGGSFMEQGVPHPAVALSQLDDLVTIVGTPRRVSIRFDPIIWMSVSVSLSGTIRLKREPPKRTSSMWISHSSRKSRMRGFYTRSQRIMGSIFTSVARHLSVWPLILRLPPASMGLSFRISIRSKHLSQLRKTGHSGKNVSAPSLWILGATHSSARTVVFTATPTQNFSLNYS